MFNNQIAILFDSENVKPHEILDLLFDKLEKQGFTLIYPRKLIVHDLNKIKKNELIEDLKKYRLELCCTYGEFRKNLLDFRLYVECLDLAYTSDIPTFCIVSNDQDYAELCIKLHTLNKKVIGVGSNKTSTEEYISLFDDYIFVEDLKPKEKQVKTEVKKESKTKTKETKLSKRKQTEFLLEEAINLALVNTFQNNKDKLYYSNLVAEIKKIPQFSKIKLTQERLQNLGYHLEYEDKDKKETAYISLKTNYNE